MTILSENFVAVRHPMSKFTRRLLTAISLLVFGGGWTSAEGTKPFQPIDAEALIAECWKVSEEDRGPGASTAQMRSGTLRTVICFEELIVAQLMILFPNGEYLSPQQGQEYLDQVRNALGKLYWSIYNQHRGCGISCGTIKHPLHLAAIVEVYEDIVRAIIFERNFYKF